MKLPIYIATSDRTLKTIKSQIYCINKFWPGQEVHVLGYKSPDFPLSNNFTFHSMGIDPGPNKFSNAIRRFIEKNAPKYFIFTTDDVLPIKKVDQELLTWLIKNYCDDSIARIGLWNDIQKHKCTAYAKGIYTIVKAAINTKYRVSLPWSIWRREALLDVFIDDLSPWETESKRTLTQDVIGTRGLYVIHPSHGMYSANIPHSWEHCICCGIPIDKQSYHELKDIVAWKQEL